MSINNKFISFSTENLQIICPWFPCIEIVKSVAIFSPKSGC